MSTDPQKEISRMSIKQGPIKVRRFAIQFRHSVISALALMSVWSPCRIGAG